MRLYPEIERRLRRLLERLALGDDAPPGPRLRLEGLCEAAVLTGECDVPAIDALLDSLHRELRGRSLDEALGAHWRQAHPFPELPLYMDRAPVSPSGSP
mgnify:CR=1 FL=1